MVSGSRIKQKGTVPSLLPMASIICKGFGKPVKLLTGFNSKKVASITKVNSLTASLVEVAVVFDLTAASR